MQLLMQAFAISHLDCCDDPLTGLPSESSPGDSKCSNTSHFSSMLPWWWNELPNSALSAISILTLKNILKHKHSNVRQEHRNEVKTLIIPPSTEHKRRGCRKATRYGITYEQKITQGWGKTKQHMGIAKITKSRVNNYRKQLRTMIGKQET